MEHISTIYHNYHDDVPFSVVPFIAHFTAHFSAGHGDFFGWSCFMAPGCRKRDPANEGEEIGGDPTRDLAIQNGSSTN